jgi:peptidoglycan/LPS O-acetylase OafA/YrhL
MPCRADALAFGVAAALMVRTPKLWETVIRYRKLLYAAFGIMLAAIIGLLMSGFEPFTNQLFGLEYSLLALLYFLLLLGTLTSKSFQAVFSRRWIRYLGTLAYGLYLLHIPCLSVLQQFATQVHPAPSGWVKLIVSCAGVALAILLAAVSWKYFEQPMIRRGYQYQYDSKSPEIAPGPVPVLT